MGLIKEPAGVDFTTISRTWTAKEEKEFSKLIREQKEMRKKKQMHFPVNLVASKHNHISTLNN
jgi:hypothetical protein